MGRNRIGWITVIIALLLLGYGFGAQAAPVRACNGVELVADFCCVFSWPCCQSVPEPRPVEPKCDRDYGPCPADD